MVIEEIIIKNFQSHSNTHLYLSEGVNAIVGDTDSGKSSLFRALTWLFRNRPIINIEEYQSKWGGDVHVAAKYNGTWIGRVRNKSKNYYYIGEDIEVNRLEGFGNGPPPQKVVDLLNLGDVNFMSQQALPFLLSQGSGAIGRFLNEAANLDVIDRSTAFIASVLKKEKAELESTVSLSEDTIKVLKEFDWVDRADEALSALETLSKSVEENDKKIIALDDLLNDIDRIEEKIENIQPALNLENEIISAEKLKKQIAKDTEKLNHLLQLLTDIKNIEEKIEKNRPFLDLENEIMGAEKLKKQIVKDTEKKNNLDILLIEIEDVEEDVEKCTESLEYENEIKGLNDLNEKIQKLSSESMSLNVLLTVIRSTEEKIGVAQIDVDDAEKEFHANFPDVCPLCQQIKEI